MSVLAHNIAQAEQQAAPLPQAPVPTGIAVNQSPVVNRKKIPTVLILLAIILLFVLAAVGAMIFTLSKDKKAVTSLAATQVENFNNLQNNYRQIVLEVKEADEEENKPTSNQLLKINSFENDQQEILNQVEDKVLGIEDTAELQLSRKLKQLYQQAQADNQKIIQQNQLVADKIKTFPLLLTMSPVADLTDKTADFTDDTKGILEFLEQDEAVTIELLAWIDDFNLVLQMSITSNGSQQSVDKLADKLDELAQLEMKYNMITTSGLPVYLIDYKKNSTAQLKILREILTEMKEAIAIRDVNALLAALEKLGLEVYSSSNSSTTEWTTFWQDNETIRQTDSLKKDWQELERSSKTLI